VGEDFDRFIGPTFQGSLDPGKFRPVSAPEVRSVQLNEAAIDPFRAECGSSAWESSGLDEIKGRAAAYFQGTRIAAMAGYRPWSDLAGDPCVLTHPEFRGRGYGTAVVSAVVNQALQEGNLLLYQTLEANQGAMRIARTLGFKQYARRVAVRLKG
jgi:predicted GNAT family acetyltransferase